MRNLFLLLSPGKKGPGSRRELVDLGFRQTPNRTIEEPEDKDRLAKVTNIHLDGATPPEPVEKPKTPISRIAKQRNYFTIPNHGETVIEIKAAATGDSSRKEPVRGLVRKLSIQQDTSTACLRIGPIFIRLLAVEGQNLFDLEVINPEELMVKIDDSEVGNHKHMVLQNVSVNSIIRFADLIKIRNSRLQESFRSGFKFTIDADNSVLIDNVQLSQRSTRFTTNKGILTFTNFNSPIKHDFAEEQFSITASPFDPEKLELEVASTDPKKQIQTSKFTLDATSPSIELPAFGKRITLTENYKYTDTLNASSVKVEYLS